jgi:hypothetical protein
MEIIYFNTLNFEENKHCTKYGLSVEEFKKKKRSYVGISENTQVRIFYHLDILL